MTMKILLKTTNGNLFDSYVHDEHEIDMFDFLKNHGNKHEITTLTKDIVGVEWFYLELTPEDVKTIKETTWYKNTKWDKPYLDGILDNIATIEVLVFEYIPKGEN